MTAAMAALGFGSDQVAGDDLAFQSLYFVGSLLFFMTFLLNFVSDRSSPACGRCTDHGPHHPATVGGAAAADITRCADQAQASNVRSKS